MAYSKEYCIFLLQSKKKQLENDGLARYPSRSDFSVDEVIAIKAHLGPWPRALEKAGLKERKIKK